MTHPIAIIERERAARIAEAECLTITGPLSPGISMDDIRIQAAIIQATGKSIASAIRAGLAPHPDHAARTERKRCAQIVAAYPDHPNLASNELALFIIAEIVTAIRSQP